MTIKYEVKQKVVEYYLNNPESTQVEVANYFGIHKDSVLKILREFEIPIRPYTGDRTISRRIRYFDFEFFNRKDKITAYWAGFFMADGHVTFGETGGATFVCYVAPKDSWHIQQFYDDIQYKEPLKFRKDGYAGLELHYAGFRNQLPPWGIIPNKTHIFQSPIMTNSKNISHYIRG